MQFCKLRYFFKLINARQHTCQLLKLTAVLMTLMMSLASSDGVDATSKAALNVFEKGSITQPLSVGIDTNITDSFTNKVINAAENVTVAAVDNYDVDDFEQMLTAQLKREEEEASAATSAEMSPKLKTQTGYTTNGDYDTIAANNGPTTSRKSLLSRKRRYLLFPEGSSFQVVYDGIIGIVDYTNYLILGITLALAWELPTKPPSEQLEDIKQQVEDGTLLLPRNDTATKITYVDTKSTSKKKFLKNQQKAKGQLQQQTKAIYKETQLGSQRKSYYKMKPYYDNYYNDSKRRRRPTLLQPVFMPPMHRNYYYQQGNKQSAGAGGGAVANGRADMRSSHNSHGQHIRPGSTMKYAYYFQPHMSASSFSGSSSSSSRRYGQDPYKRYYYRSFGNDYGKEHADDWRRKDNFYYKHDSVGGGGGGSAYGQSLHPFKNWLASQTAAATTAYTQNDRTKYPWWNLATRLTNSFRKGATSANRNQQAARQFSNVNNNDDDADDGGVVEHRQHQQQKMQLSEHQGYNQSLVYSSSSAKVSSSLPTSARPAEANGAQANAIPRKHRIYPVFGKRSLPDDSQQKQQKQHPVKMSATMAKAQTETEPEMAHQPQHEKHQQRKRFRRCGIDSDDSDELSKFDRIHIRHHRHTRHTLYEKIEKYLDKRGSHGHHCVLRALCETAKKSNEREPGTFLGELMRTVFTLPEPVDEDLHKLGYKESRYDAAHAYEGNCATRYFHCKDSLWKSHFIA